MIRRHSRDHHQFQHDSLVVEPGIIMTNVTIQALPIMTKVNNMYFPCSDYEIS